MPVAKGIAEGFGLAIEHDSKIGWSVTTLPQDAAAHYADAIRALDAAITAHRRAELSVTAGGRKSNNNGAAATCGCGFKVWDSRGRQPLSGSPSGGTGSRTTTANSAFWR